MRGTAIVSLLAAVASTQVAAQTSTSAAGPLGTAAPPAPIANNNPAGVAYKAVLPDTAFTKSAFPDGGNIQGDVTAVAAPGGVGVQFTIKFSNLPKVGGPFPYHLHVNPVPSNGNCTATLAHLDPFARGEDPKCDAAHPETCQVGDLSGKHGAIPANVSTWEASYVDLYASTVEGIGAFFGNRSLVIHFPNKTRITCASFESASGSATLSTGTGVIQPTGTSNSTGTYSSGSPTGTTSPAQTSAVTAGGSSMSVGIAGSGVVAFAAAIMFML